MGRRHAGEAVAAAVHVERVRGALPPLHPQHNTRERCAMHTAMKKKWRIVRLGFGTARQKVLLE
jgi:hypothetical protein